LGAAAFGIATLASLRSPQRGVHCKAKAFYRTDFTPPLQFSLHDEKHAFRVAQRMDQLMTSEDISDLSDYEVAILLLSAYLHDIGMVPERVMSDAHKHFLLSGKPGALNEQQRKEFRCWLDDDERGISVPIKEGTPTHDTLDLADELTAYYIRSRHNDWSREWIERHHDGVPSLYEGWLDDLILVCQSHHFAREHLAKPKFDGCVRGHPPQPVQLRYLSCVLRIADILENDPERTPDVLFKHRGIGKESARFWFKDHFVTINVNGAAVEIIGRPKSALIHKAHLEMADAINSELADCAWLRDHSNLNICVGLNRQLTRCWRLEPSARVDICEDEGSDYQFIKGAFHPRTDRLLELIGSEQLYGSPFAAVRELLQNAFDAVREKIAYIRLKEDEPSLTQHGIKLGNQEAVYLRIYEGDGRWWLECQDTGVGMTKQIIESSMLRSAQGGRGEIRTLQRECREAGFELGRTGQFGIGVLSYFMLADQVVIITRRSQIVSSGSLVSDTLQFIMDGLGDFGELRKITQDCLSDDGTIVRFRIRESRAKDIHRFCVQLVKRICEYIAYTPCQLKLELPPEIDAKPKIQFSTGWIRNEEAAADLIQDAWEKRDFTFGPTLSMFPKGNKEIEKSAYSESKKKMEWLAREGVVLGNKVAFRVRLPVFIETEGMALAAFFENGDHRISPLSQKIGCYLATPELFFGSWKGINASLDFNSIKFGPEYMFGDRIGSSRGKGFAHPFLIEVDILDAPGASLSADRAEVRLSKVFAFKLVKTIREECDALLDSNLALFAADNPYADFNRWRSGRNVQATINSRWFIRNNSSVRFERWSFPFTIGHNFSYFSDLNFEYCGRTVTQLAYAKSAVGAEAYGPFPSNSGLELRVPDRLCLLIKQADHNADAELGFWPLWIDDAQWIGCRFPDVWQLLAGFNLSWREVVWNKQNPLVNLAGIDALIAEETNEWLSLWWGSEDEDLRIKVLSCPAYAAQALLLSGLHEPPPAKNGVKELWEKLWSLCAKCLQTDLNALRFCMADSNAIEWHGLTAITKIRNLTSKTWPAELRLPDNDAEILLVH